jgi:uncharacterized protein
MKLSRRHFLRSAGAYTAGIVGLRAFMGDASALAQAPEQARQYGFGDLVEDPDGLLDLPRDFSYHAFSRTGDEMDDGFITPGRPDGMGTFPGPNGSTILLRNHELDPDDGLGPFGPGNELLPGVDLEKLYDSGGGSSPAPGGTTTLVYDTAARSLLQSSLSLAGTVRNCAGGATPWNTWISCEETADRVGAFGTYERDHGYNFEVPATATMGLVTPTPLTAMGRFKHEAVAVDPNSGIVYQTEDRDEGLIYRFIPDSPGVLAAGGRLQALAVKGTPRVDTRNWSGRVIAVGEPMDVEWVDIADVESPGDNLRFRGFSDGAARFASGEGMWYGNDAIYFTCTEGGGSRIGQIWRYVPSPLEGQPGEAANPGSLSLFQEPNDMDVVEEADNGTVAPWGDLILSEDGSGDQFLVGVTPAGAFYKFARNAHADSDELTGVTFSPDGSTLFVNIQEPGITLAIQGPWHLHGVAVEPRGLALTTLASVKRPELLQNFPNPFNPETWIPYRLPEDDDVTISIYAIGGGLVRTLRLGYQPAGDHLSRSSAAHWDGRDEDGEFVASGVYAYVFKTARYTATKRLTVRQ